MLCVALLMCMFVLCVACLTVFVNCLVKQFAICLGVFVILLLNVTELLNVVGGALLDRPCMSEVISSFRSFIAVSQVFALLMLFLCVILHTMYSGQSLQLLCIFTIGMLCLSVISMMFVKIMCVYWWVWWSEGKRTLVAGECPSVLL